MVSLEHQEGVDFLVRQGERRALVETRNAHAVLERDREQDLAGYPRARISKRLAETLRRSAPPEDRLSCREAIVEAGAVVTVVGVGRWEVDPEGVVIESAGYRGGVRSDRLVLVAPDPDPLVITNE